MNLVLEYIIQKMNKEIEGDQPALTLSLEGIQKYKKLLNPGEPPNCVLLKSELNLKCAQLQKTYLEHIPKNATAYVRFATSIMYVDENREWTNTKHIGQKYLQEFDEKLGIDDLLKDTPKELSEKDLAEISSKTRHAKYLTHYLLNEEMHCLNLFSNRQIDLAYIENEYIKHKKKNEKCGKKHINRHWPKIEGSLLDYIFNELYISPVRVLELLVTPGTYTFYINKFKSPDALKQASVDLLSFFDPSKPWELILSPLFDLISEEPRERFIKISVPSFLSEVLPILCNPTLLNQVGNLCGVAAFLQYLARYWPSKFLAFAISLYKEGKTTVPFVMKIDSASSTSEILTAMQVAVRDQANANYTLKLSYNISFFKSLNKLPIIGENLADSLERLNGCTLPKDFDYWVRQAGGNIRLNTAYITGGDLKRMPHLSISNILAGEIINGPEEGEKIHIEEIRNQLLNGNCVIAHISSSLASKISSVVTNPTFIENITSDEVPEKSKTLFLGADLSHFVTILDLKKDKKGDYIFCVSTWGNMKNIKISPEVFEKHFFGIVCLEGSESFTQEEMPFSESNIRGMDLL